MDDDLLDCPDADFTTIQEAIDADVVIHIYDVSGRLVRELEFGFKEAGSYMSRSKAVYWSGRNEMDEMVASGVYL